MQVGIDSFVALSPHPVSGKLRGAEERLQHLLDEISLADEVGLDVFGIGEHHRRDFADSAPTILLAAAAARTRRIRLASAVTVLSALDPVRLFQQFATIDLLSQGRAEIVAGRGSFIDAFPLFGYDLADYDDLFTEKLELLMRLRESEIVTWKGRFRPALDHQGVYPRPRQTPLPLWVGVGGTPAFFERAGHLGLPLMIAIIGGNPARFEPLISLYRRAWDAAGHPAEGRKIGVHMLGCLANTDARAADDFFPGYARTFTEIGRERGWPPVTRRHFDALLGQDGALLVGTPETVAEKVKRVNRVLGGIDRLSLQISVADLSHEQTLSTIRLAGESLRPALQKI